jgi:2-methylcitrate dehydratase PrpD
MKVSTLEARPELTALFRKGARPAAVGVTTQRGVFQREVLYPKGDPNNPMTWADVTDKFRAQAEPILGSKAAREVVQRAAAIETEANMRTFAELLAAPTNV